MKNEKPLILVSNDDGVDAKGINELIKYLRPLGDVVVMAPDSGRSGMSCAITADKPVKYQLVRQEEGLTIYKCTGTPVDCIKLAMYAVLERMPDVIIGGINHGSNAATNVHYSGTMGIVIEGCLLGTSAIGYSLCDHKPDADFSHTAKYICNITRNVLKKGLPKGTCLNVNFPAGPIKGIRVCTQAAGKWTHEWERRERPQGGEYFWLTGEFENHDSDNDGNDNWALDHGYGAITPTKVDVTAYEIISELKTWNLND